MINPILENVKKKSDPWYLWLQFTFSEASLETDVFRLSLGWLRSKQIFMKRCIPSSHLSAGFS